MAFERPTPVIVRKRKSAAAKAIRPGSFAAAQSPRSLPKSYSLNDVTLQKAHKSADWTRSRSAEDSMHRETRGLFRSVSTWALAGVKTVFSRVRGREGGDDHDETETSSTAAAVEAQKTKKRRIEQEKRTLESQFVTPAKQTKKPLSQELENMTFNPVVKDNYDAHDISFAQSPYPWDMEKVSAPKRQESTSTVIHTKLNGSGENYGTSFLRRSNKPSHSKNIHSEHLHSVYKGTFRSSASPSDRLTPPTPIKPQEENVKDRIKSLTEQIKSAFFDKSKDVTAKQLPDLMIIKERKLPPPTPSTYSFKFDASNLTFSDDFNYYKRKLQERQELHDRIHKETLEAAKPKSKLIPQVCEEDVNTVIDIWKYKGKDDVIIASVNNIDVRVRDFRTLADGRWLNDTVIEAYVKTLDTPQVHCFSSFFFTNLEERGYTGVGKWLKRAKKQLNALDRIICPINVGSTHWVCGVIDLKKKTIYYMDSLSTSETKHGERSLKLLQQYLTGEAKKQGCPEVAEGMKHVIITDCPQQQNGSDCGIFTLMNALHFAKGSELTYDSSEAKNFRRLVASTFLKLSKKK